MTQKFSLDNKKQRGLNEPQSYAISDQGKVREHNEDAYLELIKQGLWVVADGAGGHEKGEVASQLIVEKLSTFEKKQTLSESVNWIIKQLRAVNTTLISMRKQLTKGGMIGSTVCVLLFFEGHFVCLWAGDSRIYLYRHHQLLLLTQDHNRREEFFKAGFDEAELSNYPMAAQLTKAIGARDQLSIDVQLYEHLTEDIFLLCSDGLTGELTTKEIESTIGKHNSVHSMAKNLIASVLDGAAKDNVTVVLVK